MTIEVDEEYLWALEVMNESGVEPESRSDFKKAREVLNGEAPRLYEQ